MVLFAGTLFGPSLSTISRWGFGCPAMSRYGRRISFIMNAITAMDQRRVSTNAAHRQFELVWGLQIACNRYNNEQDKT